MSLKRGHSFAVNHILWKTVVYINYAKDGSRVQRVLLLHVQDMAVQLFVMFSRAQGTKDVKMKQQQSLNIKIAFT